MYRDKINKDGNPCKNGVAKYLKKNKKRQEKVWWEGKGYYLCVPFKRGDSFESENGGKKKNIFFVEKFDSLGIKNYHCIRLRK